jgi:hypothetical protein
LRLNSMESSRLTSHVKTESGTNIISSVSIIRGSCVEWRCRSEILVAECNVVSRAGAAERSSETANTNRMCKPGFFPSGVEWRQPVFQT